MGIHAEQLNKDTTLTGTNNLGINVTDSTPTFGGSALWTFPAGSLQVTSDPSSDNDVPNKAYVDSVASGLDPKGSCAAATITILDNNTDISGTPTFDPTAGTNSAGLISATLAVSGVFSVDGVTLASDDRLLVKNEHSGTEAVMSIDAVADVAGSLNNTYFAFATLQNIAFYVWFNVASGGTDPTPTPPAGLSWQPIEVAIATNATAATVAGAVRAAIDAYTIDVGHGGQPTVGGTIAHIVITNAGGGDVPTISAGTSGFQNASEDTPGTGMSGSANGIWVVTISGTALTLNRASDFDGTPSAEVSGGAFTFVEEGTINDNSGWVLTNSGEVPVGGTTSEALLFNQFSGAGSITAGSGLTKVGDTINFADGSTGNHNGLNISPNDVSVAAGPGLDIVANILIVEADSLSGGNIQPVNLTTDGVGVDIAAIAGTGIEADGSANLRLATQGNGIAGGNGSTLSVAADSTTGTTVAPVSVTANGVGVTVDDDTIIHTAGELSVAHLPNAIEDGNGIVDFAYNGDGAATVAVQPDTTAILGTSANAITVGPAGVNVSVDNVTIDSTAGTGGGPGSIKVKEGGITELHIAATTLGTNSGLTGFGGSKLFIDPDSETGATVVPINLTANGAGVLLDNVTVTNNSGTLQVKDNGISVNQINSAIAGNALGGGSGSALFVDIHTATDGTGITLVDSDEMLVYDADGGANNGKRITMSQIQDYISTSGLDFDLTDGNGIVDFIFNGNANASVAVEADITSTNAALANAISVQATGVNISVDNSTIEGSQQGAGGAASLRVKGAGINETHIAQTSFSATGGIAGGTGSKIAIDVSTLNDTSGTAVTANDWIIRDSGVEGRVQMSDVLAYISGAMVLPNDLTDGNGIADFTYNGSGAASVAVQAATAAGSQQYGGIVVNRTSDGTGVDGANGYLAVATDNISTVITAANLLAIKAGGVDTLQLANGAATIVKLGIEFNEEIVQANGFTSADPSVYTIGTNGGTTPALVDANAYVYSQLLRNGVADMLRQPTGTVMTGQGATKWKINGTGTAVEIGANISASGNTYTLRYLAEQ